MLKVLFCGGGSVGHLAPSLAVWEEVQRRSRAASALFVCSRRSGDRQFLRTQGVRHIAIDAPKWALSPLIILFPLQFLLGFFESLILFLTFRPTVIFSKGGYVSVPVCLMGWLFRIPIVLHESDRTLGRANRLLLCFARHLCIGTPQKELAESEKIARLRIPVTATGNPIRRYLLRGSHDAGKSLTGFSGKKPVLLIIGGSQGSRALNEAVREHLTLLLDFCDIIHLTGRGKGQEVQHARYFVRAWVESELADLYALASIVLSRAGASVIAELSALGKTMVIVPLPEIAHGHQGANAHFLEVAGAVLVLPQEHLRERLVPTVCELAKNENKRKELGEHLHAFAVPNAAEKIAQILLEEVTK